MRRLGLVLLVAALCLRVPAVDDDDHGEAGRQRHDRSGDRRDAAGAGDAAQLRARRAATSRRNVQMFGPEQAQAAAASMGVRFVSGEPIKTAESEGYRAHFAFDDVTKMKFDMVKTRRSGRGEEARRRRSAFGFTKGDGVVGADDQHARPTVRRRVAPQPDPRRRRASRKDNQQALAMLMPMLRGLFVDVTLNVDGRVIKTNAPYVTRLAGHAAAVRFRQGECHGGGAAEAADRSPIRNFSRTSPACGW